MEIILLKDFKQESPDTTFPKGSTIIVGDSVAKRLGDAGFCDYEAAKAKADAEQAAAIALDEIVKAQAAPAVKKKAASNAKELKHKA